MFSLAKRYSTTMVCAAREMFALKQPLNPSRSMSYSRELLNCLSEAQMVLAEKNSVAFDKIHAAVAADLFVVVAQAPYYCASTDGLAGTAYGIRGTFATREEAELKVADEQDCEIPLSIHPTPEMEAFRASGLPDDAFSDWKHERNAAAAYERSLSDRMGPELPF